MSPIVPNEETDEETCEVLDHLPWCGIHDLDRLPFAEELLNSNQLADYVHSLDADEGNEDHAENLALPIPRR